VLRSDRYQEMWVRVLRLVQAPVWLQEVPWAQEMPVLQPVRFRLDMTPFTRSA
jgi:hypothetical protein